MQTCFFWSTQRPGTPEWTGRNLSRGLETTRRCKWKCSRTTMNLVGTSIWTCATATKMSRGISVAAASAREKTLKILFMDHESTFLAMAFQRLATVNCVIDLLSETNAVVFNMVKIQRTTPQNFSIDKVHVYLCVRCSSCQALHSFMNNSDGCTRNQMRGEGHHMATQRNTVHTMVGAQQWTTHLSSTQKKSARIAKKQQNKMSNNWK